MDRPQTTEGDIAEHRLAPLLFAAWNGTADDGILATLAAGPPPGPIALRCRYRHLLDQARTASTASTASTQAGPEPVPIESWNRSIRLETEGDVAIHAGDFARAEQAFRTMIDDAGLDAVATANARIGLGDVHRSRDDVERAVEEYEAALRAADQAGYRFGRLRALIPLGYLTLAHHSAARARKIFEEGRTLADALADPVYLANAVQGMAESDERSGSTAAAIEGYEHAYLLFDAARAPTGQAHAAQRLGALHHRTGRVDLARDWLVHAAQAFAQGSDAVGMINVLEGLGDILLDADDPDLAEVQFRAAHSIAVDCGLAGAEAHALHNLGRLARSRGDWNGAVQLFEASVTAYRRQEDLLGVCTALGKLAESRERIDDTGGALRDRVSAVFAIEEYRAAHREAAAQHEYRVRFADVYALALRAAVAVGAPEDFAVVADGLAGRRLAGLAGAELPPGMTDDLTLLQHFVVSADQRWKALARPAGTAGMHLAPGTPRRERINRMLGSAGVLGGLREPAEAAIDDVLAALYLSPAADGGDLLSALPADCHSLQLLLDPADPRILHRLWREPGGRARLDSVTLPAACLKTLSILQGNSDERSALRPDGLTALTDLVPAPLREAMAETGENTRMLLLPVGDLWLIPWGAVPLRPGLLLGQAVEYAVCPSLAVQRILRRRGPAPPSDQPAGYWRSPVLDQLGLASSTAASRRDFASAAEAKASLGMGVHTVILVCHGRPLAGPIHYLELDFENWLLPSDVLTATPPARLYLITCWGAGVPGQSMTDPVSVATLALARGSAEVLATVGEFGDTPLGNQFVQWVMQDLETAETSASAAVHSATKTLMSFPGTWDWALRDWAPLLPIGTFHN